MMIFSPRWLAFQDLKCSILIKSDLYEDTREIGGSSANVDFRLLSFQLV